MPEALMNIVFLTNIYVYILQRHAKTTIVHIEWISTHVYILNYYLYTLLINNETFYGSIVEVVHAAQVNSMNCISVNDWYIRNK